MKTAPIIVGVLAVIALVFGIYIIDIDQTREAELPEVTVEGGQLPGFDAEVGDIEITEETVTVPAIEVTPPNEDG